MSVSLGPVSAALLCSVFIPSIPDLVVEARARFRNNAGLEIEPGVNFAQADNAHSNVITEELVTMSKISLRDRENVYGVQYSYLSSTLVKD